MNDISMPGRAKAQNRTGAETAMSKPVRIIVYTLAAVWLAVLLRLTVFRNGCFSHGLFTG